MALRGRYNYELPIEMKNVCLHKLYGLPDILEIQGKFKVYLNGLNSIAIEGMIE